MRKLIVGMLIALLLSGCSTPEAKQRWKNVAAVAAIGAIAFAAARGARAGTANTGTAYDYDWDWDLFLNSGRYEWACRGLQSGQFAEQSKCAYKLKIDHWPNN